MPRAVKKAWAHVRQSGNLVYCGFEVWPKDFAFEDAAYARSICSQPNYPIGVCPACLAEISPDLK